MIGLLQDFRFALRQLRRNPGFTFTATVMLAVAISANSTIFSWIDGTMLHPIPGAREMGSLVSVMRGQRVAMPSPPLSYQDYRDLRERNHTLSGLLGYHHDWLTLTGGVPQRIYVANVSANFFDVLGVRPALGRFFLPDEEAREGGVPYVVLSYSLWQTRYGGDPGIVGKSIELARRPITVIGVAPRGFVSAMPGVQQDAWLALDPLGTDRGRMTSRSASYLNVLGRLKPGVSRQLAAQDLDTIMRRIVAEYPGEHPGVNTITLDPMWRSPFGANVYMAASLPILLAIAGVVLLLICANVATLALVRFVSRRRELAIRQSLGSGRLQLMRQMILEIMLVSLAGGVAALLLTQWTAKRLGDFIPPNANPILLNGAVDKNVLFAIVLLVLVAGVICGGLPAWLSSKVSAAEVLKDEAANISGGGRSRVMLSVLVVAQIGLSLALLVCSGLLLRTMRNMSNADPGFRSDHILTASVGLSIAGYPRDEALAIQHKILDRVAALPGVQVAAVTDWLPFNFNGRSVDAYPEGYVPQQHESNMVRLGDVTAGFFESMGIAVVNGRNFTRDDDENAPRVVIVDEAAAARYWPGQNPLGHRLMIWGSPYSVVGVVKNTKHQFINEQPESMIYRSFFQGADETTIMVRTSGPPTELSPAVVDAIHAVDGQLAVFDVRLLRDTTRMSNVFAVMESTFAGIFALIALVLSATGIYGVVAYRTQLRTHEIGIRMALGASPGDVLLMLMRQGLRMTIVGVVLGLLLSLGMTRFVSGMLYGIGTNDPLTVAGVVAVLAAVSMLACYLPAYRAMRMNPVDAIREL